MKFLAPSASFQPTPTAAQKVFAIYELLERIETLANKQHTNIRLDERRFALQSGFLAVIADSTILRK
ncbi:hypothetical protein AC578_1776 [Pseudocercospora eumusae]|uniref:Uncharacterized protein n=1 Tax=Pseudocercospora eumusae TaxID=321146 RepID=A0A139H7M6_9PEZI|nr:hypothetical protein AC578_1776 [Pseudocercospora eumusae]